MTGRRGDEGRVCLCDRPDGTCAGLAVGAGLGAVMGKVAKTGIDKQFQDQVRDMLKPGTSALFLVVEKVTPDKAVEGLRQYGGVVLKSSLSKDAEAQLQDALHGEQAAA